MSRRRRIRPREKRSTHWWRVGLVAVVGLSLVGALLLRANELRIEGAVMADTDRLSEMLRPELGNRLLFAGRGPLVNELAQDPWIAQLEIRRQLPGTLRVMIRERAALFRLPGEAGAVDSEGNFLPRRGEVDWTGLPRLQLAKGEDWEAAFPIARDALAAVEAAGWPLPTPLTSIRVRKNGEVELLDRRGVCLLVGDREFAPRLARFAATRERLSAAPGDEVDLRYERQIIVRPAAAEGS